MAKAEIYPMMDLAEVHRNFRVVYGHLSWGYTNGDFHFSNELVEGVECRDN
jgi:hypothetical protein